MSPVFLQGVEVPLPDGERVLWQGAPARTELLLHAFHARKVAIYFGLLIVLAAVFAGESATPMHTFLTATMWLCISAAVASAFLFVFAALASRTSLYAITERRVVMKIGIALPVVLNVPLAIIDSVNLKARAKNRGDIALQLAGDSRVAYLVLWPHARAWHMRHPEPLLRGVENAAQVGKMLSDAIVAQMKSATPAVTVEPGIADMLPAVERMVESEVAVPLSAEHGLSTSSARAGAAA